MPELEPFLGAGAETRATRSRTLTLVPYLVGGTLFVVAGLLKPHCVSLVLISAAAASFGGTSLLAWYRTVWTRRVPAVGRGPAARCAAERAWLLLGAVILGVFVGRAPVPAGPAPASRGLDEVGVDGVRPGHLTGPAIMCGRMNPRHLTRDIACCSPAPAAYRTARAAAPARRGTPGDRRLPYTGATRAAPVRSERPRWP